MKHKIPFAVIIIVLALLTQNVLADLPIKLRVANYFPFYFKNKDTPEGWDGLEIEIVRAICKEADMKIVYLNIPWSRALMYMNSGEIDLMMGLSKTPEREKFIDYIGVSRYEQMGLVVHSINKNVVIKTLDDLKKFDRKIGLMNNVIYPTITERIAVDEEFKKNFEFVSSDTQNRRKTQVHRIIGYFADRLFIVNELKSKPEYKGLSIHSFTLSKPKPVYIGASRKMDEKKRIKLKEAYRILSKNGTIGAVIKRWGQL